MVDFNLVTQVVFGPGILCLESHKHKQQQPVESSEKTKIVGEVVFRDKLCGYAVCQKSKTWLCSCLLS